MTSFKGTKGMWVLDSGFPNLTGIDILTEKGWTSESPWIAHVHKNHVGVELQEGKANALLISKAPEMLEMLEKTVEFFDEGGSNYSTVAKFLNEIKELIKEATTT